MKSVRSIALLLVLAGVLPAQKLSLLGSFEAGLRPVGTQAAVMDGTGLYTVTLSGSRFMLQKMDSAGNTLWRSRSGEASWVTASVTAAAGAVYVAGVVNGAAPGQAGAGHFDMYLARYDGDGNQLWMRQFGTSDDDEGGAIAADAGGVYITFATWVFARQNYAASLRKYSPDGSLLWTRDFTSLAHWWMPVASGGSSLYLAASSSDGQSAFSFLRKYSADGHEEWTRRYPAQRPGISGLAADSSGVYAVLDDYSISGSNSSVRKYGSDGNELWSSPLGAFAGPGMPLRSIAADGTALYVGSSVRTSLPAQCYAGNEDAAVRKYDTSTGGEIWTREFGTYGPDPVAGLAGNGAEVFVLAGESVAKLASAPAEDAAPRIVNECILNAASNLGGGVVPGEIVTVAVTGEVTRLLFNGAPGSILAASEQRITALVPFELAGRNLVNVQVESHGIVSEAVTLPVLPERLGIFSADRSGNGQAAIVNEDGTVNGPANPARPGSAISIYATGGAPDAVAVAISDEMKAYPEVDGGAEDYRYYAPILDASAADGLLQINLRVPEGVLPGSAVPLHIRSGSVPVEQLLTIAIGR